MAPVVANADCAKILHPKLSQVIEENYVDTASRFLNLSAGAILEGSSRHGGLQPDYLIDIDNPVFDGLREFVRGLVTKQDMSYWTKVSSVTQYIQSEMLYRRDYDDETYQKLIAHYRLLNIPIPLSEYVKAHSGVCRENAIILHFALEWMGIENRFLYVHVNEVLESRVNEEDHAVVVVMVDGELRVVDSYHFFTYTGFRLQDLLGSGVANIDLNVSELLNNNTFPRRFERVNTYPLVLRREGPN